MLDLFRGSNQKLRIIGEGFNIRTHDWGQTANRDLPVKTANLFIAHLGAAATKLYAWEAAGKKRFQFTVAKADDALKAVDNIGEATGENNFVANALFAIYEE